jgi:F-type H+-transporting ATPase subunit beta
MQETEELSVPPVPSDGVVHAVRGAVVDIVFDGTELPPINSSLIVKWERPTALILEVHSHLDQNTLRAVAFQSTAGLARGVAVRATGGPVAVPVGKAVLGRLLDVVGNPQDDGPALPDDTPRRSIHALPPLLKSQTGTTDVFETGIKVMRTEKTLPSRALPCHRACPGHFLGFLRMNCSPAVTARR